MRAQSLKKMLFIGGGFSTVLSLRYLVEDYLATEHRSGSSVPVHITILDKNNDFGLGIAYGRSAPSVLLLNSPVSSMIVSRRGNEFLDWLDNNEEAWTELVNREPRLNAWRESNKIHLARCHYEPVFMPRAVFGLFLKSLFDTILEKAQETNTLRIELRQAEAISVTALPKGGFETTLGGGGILRADHVILAIGSPSPLSFPQAEGGKGYFPDIYTSGFEAIADIIIETAKDQTTHVACVGSNAAFMDVIHYLHNDQRLADKVRITAISRSAKPPYGGIAEGDRENYRLHCLDALQTKHDLTAVELMSAAENEIEAAKEHGYVIEDRVLDLSVRKAILEVRATLLENLSRAEKKIFSERFGGRFEGVMRRTAIESSLEARDFLEQDKLRFLSGNIKRIERAKTGFVVVYDKDETEQTLAADVAINCMGAPRLKDSDMLLIKNLLTARLITANDSGAGIKVNESFEASPGLFVMGPMLGGGTSDGGEYFHHLEDVKALGTYAPRLSKFLEVAIAVTS